MVQAIRNLGIGEILKLVHIQTKTGRAVLQENLKLQATFNTRLLHTSEEMINFPTSHKIAPQNLELPIHCHNNYILKKI